MMELFLLAKGLTLELLAAMMALRFDGQTKTSSVRSDAVRLGEEASEETQAWRKGAGTANCNQGKAESRS